LNEIARGREFNDMSDVIERLRASKQEVVSDEYEQGREAGEKWAKQTAEYAELRRLGELEEGMSQGDWESWFETSGNSAFGAAERLVFAIQPENDHDRRATQEFWEFVGGEDTERTDDFVRGFADGALSIWRDIKDQL